MQKSKHCKDKDIILRVGATNRYVDKPDLYPGSNYGKDFVDILAPGEAIPILAPGNYSIIGGGTSEAAAIVSATAALMATCHDDASALEIKAAILDNADKHKYLIPGTKSTQWKRTQY